jgi:hypothetical protein
VGQLDGDSAFADRGGDAFDGAVAHVAGGEDAGQARLQEERWPARGEPARARPRLRPVNRKAAGTSRPIGRPALLGQVTVVLPRHGHGRTTRAELRSAHAALRRSSDTGMAGHPLWRLRRHREAATEASRHATPPRRVDRPPSDPGADLRARTRGTAPRRFHGPGERPGAGAPASTKGSPPRHVRDAPDAGR